LAGRLVGQYGSSHLQYIYKTIKGRITWGGVGEGGCQLSTTAYKSSYIYRFKERVCSEKKVQDDPLLVHTTVLFAPAESER
jgi:hypothetical protein